MAIKSGREIPRMGYTDQELQGIAAELIKSLKPYGFTISELRTVLEHAIRMVGMIQYGP